LFPNWGAQTIESPLAEVVWYAVENPGYPDLNNTDQYKRLFSANPVCGRFIAALS